MLQISNAIYSNNCKYYKSQMQFTQTIANTTNLKCNILKKLHCYVLFLENKGTYTTVLKCPPSLISYFSPAVPKTCYRT